MGKILKVAFIHIEKNINGVSYKFIDNTLVEIEFHNKIFISPHGVHIGENASKLRKYHNKGRVVIKTPLWRKQRHC